MKDNNRTKQPGLRGALSSHCLTNKRTQLGNVQSNQQNKNNFLRDYQSKHQFTFRSNDNCFDNKLYQVQCEVSSFGQTHYNACHLKQENSSLFDSRNQHYKQRFSSNPSDQQIFCFRKRIQTQIPCERAIMKSSMDYIPQMKHSLRMPDQNNQKVGNVPKLGEFVIEKSMVRSTRLGSSKTLANLSQKGFQSSNKKSDQRLALERLGENVAQMKDRLNSIHSVPFEGGMSAFDHAIKSTKQVYQNISFDLRKIFDTEIERIKLIREKWIQNNRQSNQSLIEMRQKCQELLRQIQSNKGKLLVLDWAAFQKELQTKAAILQTMELTLNAPNQTSFQEISQPKSKEDFIRILFDYASSGKSPSQTSKWDSDENKTVNDTSFGTIYTDKGAFQGDNSIVLTQSMIL